jgi:hypothetical protein
MSHRLRRWQSLSMSQRLRRWQSARRAIFNGLMLNSTLPPNLIMGPEYKLIVLYRPPKKPNLKSYFSDFMNNRIIYIGCIFFILCWNHRSLKVFWIGCPGYYRKKNKNEQFYLQKLLFFFLLNQLQLDQFWYFHSYYFWFLSFIESVSSSIV